MELSVELLNGLLFGVRYFEPDLRYPFYEVHFYIGFINIRVTL